MSILDDDNPNDVLPRRWNRRWKGKRQRQRPRKTHCKNGHEQTPDNVVWHKNGKRGKRRACKLCHNERQQRLRKKHPEWVPVSARRRLLAIRDAAAAFLNAAPQQTAAARVRLESALAAYEPKP
jgi:hypothetical protein